MESLIYADPVAAVGHGVRLARAGFVFAREGAFVDVDPMMIPPGARLPLALANLIAKRNVHGTGPDFPARSIGSDPPTSRWGSSCRPGPTSSDPKVALELESLQDRVTPMSRETAVAIIEAAFGAGIETVFMDFGEPVCGGLDRAGSPRLGRDP